MDSRCFHRHKIIFHVAAGQDGFSRKSFFSSLGFCICFCLSLPLLCLASIRTRIGLLWSPGARRGSSSQAGAAIYRSISAMLRSLAVSVDFPQSPERGVSSSSSCSYHLRLCRLRLNFIQRFVQFAAHPQMMQQYCQFSCHRHHRPSFSVLAATTGQRQSPSP